MKKQWEEELKKIPVTIVFPDGGESYVQTISRIKQYPELLSFIKEVIKDRDKQWTNMLQEKIENINGNRVVLAENIFYVAMKIKELDLLKED